MVISSTPVLPPAGFAQSQPVTKTDTVAVQVNTTSHSSLNSQQAPSYLRRILIMSRQWRHKSNVHHVQTMKTSIKCSTCWHNKTSVHCVKTMKTSINCSSCWDNEDLNQLFHHVKTMKTSINCSSCWDNENISQIFIMSMKTSIKCSSCWDK